MSVFVTQTDLVLFFLLQFGSFITNAVAKGKWQRGLLQVFPLRFCIKISFGFARSFLRSCLA